MRKLIGAFNVEVKAQNKILKKNILNSDSFSIYLINNT